MKIKSLLLVAVMGLTVSLTANTNPKKAVNSEDYAEGVITMEDAWSSKALTKKELRQQKKQDRKLLRAEKKQYRMEKRTAWVMKIVERKMAKSTKKDIGGMDDPVDKWFWYWVIGWGAGLLITIIATASVSGAVFSGGFGIWWVLYLIGWICWLAGTVSLIIWLINKFG